MERARIDAALAPLLAAGLVVRASGAAPGPAQGQAHGQAGAQSGAVVPLGLDAIDAALPGGGLARAALHEFADDPGALAARALAAIVAARAGGAVFWITLARDAQEYGSLYPYGLAGLGLDPDRVFLVTAATAQDALWAMEESLRAGCAGAVIGDGLAPDLTAGRRLLLAAESGSGPALIVRSAARASFDRLRTAAATAWRIAASASAEDIGPGAPRWELTLLRCRGGRAPRHWLVEWDGVRLAVPAAAPRSQPAQREVSQARPAQARTG